MDALKFSLDEEEKLIECVKNRPLLYVLGCKSFKDLSLKDQLWKEIEILLQKPAEVVKKKWKVMRDYYCRNKRKVPLASESNEKPKYDVKRMEALKFLEHIYLPSKDNNPNSPADPTADSVYDDLCQPPSFLEVTLDCEDDNQDPIENDEISESSRREEDSGFIEPPSKRTKHSFSMTKYLEDVNAPHGTMDMEAYYHKPPRKPASSHSMGLFMNSMMETIDTFPPDLMIEAKRKIAEVVFDMESKAVCRSIVNGQR